MIVQQNTSIAPATPRAAQNAYAARAAVSRLEVAAILLLMAGDGYINGNFMQPITVGWGAFIDLMHFIPLAALLWIAVELLRPVDETAEAMARRRGLRVGVTILAVIGALVCLVMIALGALAPSLGVGVQEFSDWLAVILAGGGTALWFVALVMRRRVA
ncbi:MAG TPA: hypothetical protein VFX31_08030 [Ktedonobacterales bacterium]|jgi:hypothetical protein|nr:hypothetical protein [Ktedonobacterales bacterium]HEX5571319.1 hypothetical protein [Ktedonobacterales bacterium]